MSTDAEKWRQYTAFFEVTREHIRGIRANVTVGSNVMFSAHVGEAKKYVGELNQLTDVVMVSCFPPNSAFRVRSPTVVQEDFSKICDANPGRVIHFADVGYPSGQDCGSSLEKQKQFVEEVFAAWDSHAEQVKRLHGMMQFRGRNEVVNASLCKTETDTP